MADDIELTEDESFDGAIVRDGNPPDGAIPVKLATTARIIGMLDGDRAKSGDSDAWDVDGLMRKAKARALDPTVFDERPPFFFRSEISSDVVDSYYTRMNEKTLRNFARDATNGVAFQYAHDWSRLGLGQSLRGEFQTLDGGDEDGTKPNMRVVADFYTIPGLRFNNDMDTDSLIHGIRSGTLADVSVGFYAERFLCGFPGCGKEMILFWGMNFGECEHFPSMEYKDEKSGKKKKVFSWVDGGILSEASQVHDGATPGAEHLSAYMWTNNAPVDLRTVKQLEAHYRVKLPASPYVMQSPGIPIVGVPTVQRIGDTTYTTTVTATTSGSSVAATMAGVVPTARLSPLQPKERSMKDEETRDDPKPGTETDDEETVADELVIDDDPVTEVADVESETDEAGDPAEPTGDSEDARAMLAELRTKYKPQGIHLPATVRATVDGLCAAVLRQKQEAKDGRQYRDDLIAEAITEGVRAYGRDFDSDAERSDLDAMAIKGIKRRRDQWQVLGDIRFPGGRVTTEGGELAPRDGTGSLDETKHGLTMIPGGRSVDDRIFERA